MLAMRFMIITLASIWSKSNFENINDFTRDNQFIILCCNARYFHSNMLSFQYKNVRAHRADVK